MFTEYFDLTNCDYKDSCSRVKSHACNRCIRNKLQMTDNFAFKTYESYERFENYKKPIPPEVKVVYEEGGIFNKIKSWFSGKYE